MTLLKKLSSIRKKFNETGEKEATRSEIKDLLNKNNPTLKELEQAGNIAEKYFPGTAMKLYSTLIEITTGPEKEETVHKLFNKIGRIAEENDLFEKAIDSYRKGNFSKARELTIQLGDAEKYLKLYDTIPCFDTYLLGEGNSVERILPDYKQEHPEKYKQLVRNAISKSINYLRQNNYDSKDDNVHLKELIYLLSSINKPELANDILDRVQNVENQRKEEWITNRKQEAETLHAKFKETYDAQFEDFNKVTENGLSDINFSIKRINELYQN